MDPQRSAGNGSGMRCLAAWIITGLCLLLESCSTAPQLHVSHVVEQIPADGREHSVALIASNEFPVIQVEGPGTIRFRVSPENVDQSVLYLYSPVQPGSLTIRIRHGRVATVLHVRVVGDNTPSADGTPDWMHLHAPSDRDAFRRWFTAVADRAADMPSAQLPLEITDCASLIRYAYRETLRVHDDRWYAQFPPDSAPALTSVQQWTYPNTPSGLALFRTRSGPFQQRDLSDGTFAQFADAKTLLADNAYLLGRTLRVAKPGDLIFFRVLESNSQYHSMIITGEHGEWAVYNTGPDHGRRGEMRRVLLADLLHHPDPQWRPQPSNPNWLGVYRWNILRED